MLYIVASAGMIYHPKQHAHSREMNEADFRNRNFNLTQVVRRISRTIQLLIPFFWNTSIPLEARLQTSVTPATVPLFHPTSKRAFIREFPIDNIDQPHQLILEHSGATFPLFIKIVVPTIISKCSHKLSKDLFSSYPALLSQNVGPSSLS